MPKNNTADKKKLAEAARKRWAKKAPAPEPKKKPAKKGAASADAGTSEIGPAPILAKQFETVDTTLPLADIIPVYNARTIFAPEKLANMKESIAQYGIRNRLWVYPLPKPIKGANYGLIAGECRWMTAPEAGVLQAPVTIYKNCTALEIKLLGLMDNGQRSDLSEIETAHAYKRLIDEEGFRAWDPSCPDKSVGHQLNISKTEVYGLLKLLELPRLGQEALASGQLNRSVAVRIARIADPESRMEALKEAIADRWTDEEAAKEISQHWMTELKGAPWDLKDETLIHVDFPDRGSCEKCPFRAGNQREMFPELKGRGDVCTDPACYRARCELAFNRRVHGDSRSRWRLPHPAAFVLRTDEQCAAAGLTAHFSQVGGHYAEMDRPAYQVGEPGVSWRDLLGPSLANGAWHPVIALARDGTGRHFELVHIPSTRRKLEELGLIQAAPSAPKGVDIKAEKAALELARKIHAGQIHEIVTAAEFGSENPEEGTDAWNRRFLQYIACGFLGECPYEIATSIATSICASREIDVHGTDAVSALSSWLMQCENTRTASAVLLEILLENQRGSSVEDSQLAAFAGLFAIDLAKIAAGVKQACAASDPVKYTPWDQLDQGVQKLVLTQFKGDSLAQLRVQSFAFGGSGKSAKCVGRKLTFELAEL